MLWMLVTLVRKELQLAFRDPQSRRLLVLPVILQLLLFPFAATLEVRNATLAVLDRDGGVAARELVQRLAATAAFPRVVMLGSDRELKQQVDDQDVLLALEIPADFSRRVDSGRAAEVLAVIDGRRSNSAQIAAGYAGAIVEAYGAERAAIAGSAPPSAIVVRHRYNPNLEYKWFMLPVLVAIITTLGSLIVTALSVAREREQGTLDQLLVSPLTPGLVMIGKAIPALIVAFGQATVVAAAAVFVYRVPFLGSVGLLYLSMLCYGLALAGFGLFISSLCETQQQAFLGVFSFMVPAVMLSGFIGPVENMPLFFRGLSWIDPLTHFIAIVKGLFLKGHGFSLLWPDLWPLLLIAFFTMTSGFWMFRRRVA
jgi:ABC-2 type transport system permease protein